MTYDKVWTKFETQALAYSLLRKHLYPQFLVRGDYKLDTMRGDIVIFKANYGLDPTIRLIVQVKASKKDHSKDPNDNYNIVNEYKGTPVLEITGGEAAYNIRNLVSPYL